MPLWGVLAKIRILQYCSQASKKQEGMFVNNHVCSLRLEKSSSRGVGRCVMGSHSFGLSQSGVKTIHLLLTDALLRTSISYVSYMLWVFGLNTSSNLKNTNPKVFMPLSLCE